MLKHILLVFFPLLVFSQNYTFNADSAYFNINYLSGTLGARPMGSLNENAALHWAQGEFGRFGADTAYIMKFTHATVMNTTFITRSGITVGIFRGAVDTAIVVGGHTDSDDFDIPGANDNASGSATVVELARIWSKKPHHYTMVFCTFGGEEKGLLGSGYFVENYSDLDKVALMISTDMAGSEGRFEFLCEQNDQQAPKWLVKDALAVSRKAGFDDLTYTTHFHALLSLFEEGPGSDHIPFLKKAIPAIDFTTGIETSPIHTPQDDIRFISKEVLQKYGDFIDALISYYQENGIPQATEDRYVFWDVFGLKLFIPYWSIGIFNILSAIFGLSAFIYTVRQRRISKKSEKIRFSGIKLGLLFVLIIIFSNFGEASIQLIKGFRYPWVGHIGSYIFLTLLWVIIGFWTALRLSRDWKFSQDPSVYAMRTIIILAVFFSPLAFISARMAFYPAAALFLFGLAVFIKNPVLKTIMAGITVFPVYRVFFNEEFIFFMQLGTAAGLRIDTIVKSLVFNAVITLILLIISLPLIYALAYAAAGNDRLRNALDHVRKPITAFLTIACILALSVYLIFQPAYSEKFRPSIRVEAEYKLPERSSKLTISGNEYFKDVKVTPDSFAHYFDGRIHKTEIPVEYEADWIEVLGSTIAVKGKMDTVYVNWQVNSNRPWIQTTLQIWPDSAGISDLEITPPYYSDGNRMKFFWYGHYSDTLRIEGKFLVERGVNIIRNISSKYLDLPVDMNLTSQLANIRYQTTVQYQDTISLE